MAGKTRTDPWADLRQLLSGTASDARSPRAKTSKAISATRETEGASAITPDNRHPEANFGTPVGQEAWPPFDGEDSDIDQAG